MVIKIEDETVILHCNLVSFTNCPLCPSLSVALMMDLGIDPEV